MRLTTVYNARYPAGKDTPLQMIEDSEHGTFPVQGFFYDTRFPQNALTVNIRVQTGFHPYVSRDRLAPFEDIRIDNVHDTLARPGGRPLNSSAGSTAYANQFDFLAFVKACIDIPPDYVDSFFYSVLDANQIQSDTVQLETADERLLLSVCTDYEMKVYAPQPYAASCANPVQRRLYISSGSVPREDGTVYVFLKKDIEGSAHDGPAYNTHSILVRKARTFKHAAPPIRTLARSRAGMVAPPRAQPPVNFLSSDSDDDDGGEYVREVERQVEAASRAEQGDTRHKKRVKFALEDAEREFAEFLKQGEDEPEQRKAEAYVQQPLYQRLEVREEQVEIADERMLNLPPRVNPPREERPSPGVQTTLDTSDLQRLQEKNRITCSVPSKILDQQTKDNKLYATYAARVEGEFKSGGRTAIVAPTGSGKTRLGMLPAVLSMLANVKGGPRRHICIIACPYRVIAANFFGKLTRCRCTERPCLGKLLTSDNKDNNSLTLWFKKRAAHQFASVDAQTYQSFFSAAYFETNTIDVEGGGSVQSVTLMKKMAVDFVVGSYEMILALVRDPKVQGELNSSKLVVHAVFDEFQEALKSRETRYTTAAKLFDELSWYSKSMLVLSGSYTMVTNPSNCVSMVLSTPARTIYTKREHDRSVRKGTPNAVEREVKFEKEIVLAHPKITYNHVRDRARLVVSKCAEFREHKLSDRTSYTSMLRELQDRYPELIHMADAACHPEKGAMIVMLNDKAQAINIMNGVLFTIHIIQQALFESAPADVSGQPNKDKARVDAMSAWSLPMFFRWTFTQYEESWTDAQGNPLALRMYDGKKILEVLTSLQVQLRGIEDDRALSREARDALRDPILRDIDNIRRICDNYMPEFVLGSKEAFRKIRGGIRKTVSIESREPACGNVKGYALLVDDVRQRFTPDCRKPWDILQQQPAIGDSFRLTYVKTLEDVRHICLQSLIFVNNADENFSLSLEDELAKLRKSPRIWIATQKIGIGADLPNIRRVAQLQNRVFVMTNELTDQVLGRCDRERQSRLMFREKRRSDKGFDADDKETYMALENSEYIIKYKVSAQGNAGPISAYIDANMETIGERTYAHYELYATDSTRSFAGDILYRKASAAGHRFEATGLSTGGSKLPHSIVCRVARRSEKISEFLGDKARVLRKEVCEFFANTFGADEKRVFAFPPGDTGYFIADRVRDSTFNNAEHPLLRYARETRFVTGPEVTVDYGSAAHLMEKLSDAQRDEMSSRALFVSYNALLVDRSNLHAFVDALVGGRSPIELIGLFTSVYDLMSRKPAEPSQSDSSGYNTFCFSQTLKAVIEGSKLTSVADYMARDPVRVTQLNVDSMRIPWAQFTEASMFLISPTPALKLVKRNSEECVWLNFRGEDMRNNASLTMLVVNGLHTLPYCQLRRIVNNMGYTGTDKKSRIAKVLRSIRDTWTVLESPSNHKYRQYMLENSLLHFEVLYKISLRLKPMLDPLFKPMFAQEDKCAAMAAWFSDDRISAQNLIGCFYRRNLTCLGSEVDIDESWRAYSSTDKEEAISQKEGEENTALGPEPDEPRDGTVGADDVDVDSSPLSSE